MQPDKNELTFAFGEATTTVVVRPGLIAEIGLRLDNLPGEQPAQCVLVSDAHVTSIYGETAASSFGGGGIPIARFLIDPGEASKSFENAGRIYRFLAEHGIGRDGVIVALGGGVVSDLAGFVAATWMRGIRCAIVPTTLEAQIDAAIGGKTAINIPGAKNLVGAFHHPSMVLIDPDTLATLSDRDFRAGLAESVKHAAVFSPEFFAWHEQNAEAILARDPAVVSELIERNVRIKADVVARDPFERTGERMLLNFGHTIGHAIEQACEFRLRHGECVALGMVAACWISTELGVLDGAVLDRMGALLRKLELPVHLEQGLEFEKLAGALKADKKSRSGRLRFILLQGLGLPIVRDDVSNQVVRKAFERLLA